MGGTPSDSDQKKQRMVRIYRPRPQRVARMLLAFALLLPVAALFQAIGITRLTVFSTTALLVLAGSVLFGALRPVLIVGNHGLGVVGLFPADVNWLTWPEITAITTEGSVVSLTTTGKMVYQVQIDIRSTALLRRMVAKHAL
jgi:hypothetical protein